MKDPTKISSRQEKQVKKYVQEYFEKAVAKKKEHDKRMSERKTKGEDSGTHVVTSETPEEKREEDENDGDEDMAMSEDEDVKLNQHFAAPVIPLDQLLITEGLKRKRDPNEVADTTNEEGENITSCKRLKSESPPPPPPPPPAAEMLADPLERLHEDADSLTTSYNNSPMNNESPIKVDDLDLDYRPPPPPPPSDSVDRAESNDDGFTANRGIDSMSKSHDPDILGTPGVRSEDHENEHVDEHDEDFPGHRRRQVPELQV